MINVELDIGFILNDIRNELGNDYLLFNRRCTEFDTLVLRTVTTYKCVGCYVEVVAEMTILTHRAVVRLLNHQPTVTVFVENVYTLFF